MLARRFRGYAPLLFCVVSMGLLAGCETLSNSDISRVVNSLGSQKGRLDNETIVAGLKEALRVGTRNTVKQTSQRGGYNENPAIRIPMPDALQRVTGALRKVGLGGQVDQFERRMNRAAETAAAEAAPVFIKAIQNMSFADAREILQGGDTAATMYFKDATKAELGRRYQPIVQKAMDKVGAVQVFEKLQNRYNKLPLTPDMNYQIQDYVVEEALEGLYTVLASEEKKIRKNPAKRTTELLRRVFGSR
ncbi:MAG: DUF4197 domain-containing protein [Verrucomicrobiota bacterium]